MDQPKPNDRKTVELDLCVLAQTARVVVNDPAFMGGEVALEVVKHDYFSHNKIPVELSARERELIKYTAAVHLVVDIAIEQAKESE